MPAQQRDRHSSGIRAAQWLLAAAVVTTAACGGTTRTAAPPALSPGAQQGLLMLLAKPGETTWHVASTPPRLKRWIDVSKSTRREHTPTTRPAWRIERSGGLI